MLVGNSGMIRIDALAPNNKRLPQLNQPGIGRLETAGAEIEIGQMRVEIDMQPFATS